MKKILLILALITPMLSIAQSKKKLITKKSPTQVTKQTPKIDRSAEIDSNNKKCYFKFTKQGFRSHQDTEKDYIIYEIPDMKTTDIKTALYTTLSSMFSSPKDAISNLNETSIQLEGLTQNLIMNDNYMGELLFSIVIQFKDGKIRYNTPQIKSIHAKFFSSGSLPIIISFNMEDLTELECTLIDSYFSQLIPNINSKIKNSNDW